MAPARPPLDRDRLRAALVGDFYTEVRVLAECASTNADVLAAAAAGAPAGLLVAAERQTAGRGRLGRRWEVPAGAGLTFSLLVRPRLAGPARGLLPLLTGLAVAEAVTAAAGVPVCLKWPNDLLHAPSGGKLAGVLCESHGDAVAVGIGLNVDATPAELPVPTAASLTGVGAPTLDRTDLLAGLARAFAARYRAWAAGADVLADYRAACATLGRPVRVHTGGGVLAGTAVGVDDDGRLLVADDAGGLHPVSAGDAEHVRPGPGAP